MGDNNMHYDASSSSPNIAKVTAWSWAMISASIAYSIHLLLNALFYTECKDIYKKLTTPESVAEPVAKEPQPDMYTWECTRDENMYEKVMHVVCMHREITYKSNMDDSPSTSGSPVEGIPDHRSVSHPIICQCEPDTMALCDTVHAGADEYSPMEGSVTDTAVNVIEVETSEISTPTEDEDDARDIPEEFDFSHRSPFVPKTKQPSMRWIPDIETGLDSYYSDSCVSARSDAWLRAREDASAPSVDIIHTPSVYMDHGVGDIPNEEDFFDSEWSLPTLISLCADPVPSSNMLPQSGYTYPVF